MNSTTQFQYCSLYKYLPPAMQDIYDSLIVEVMAAGSTSPFTYYAFCDEYEDMVYKRKWIGAYSFNRAEIIAILMFRAQKN